MIFFISLPAGAIDNVSDETKGLMSKNRTEFYEKSYKETYLRRAEAYRLKGDVEAAEKDLQMGKEL